MHALGNRFDIGMVCPPAATNGAVTGKYISMTNCDTVSFVLIGGVASAGDDLQVDVQQYNPTTTTAKDLDTVDIYHYKSALVLSNAATETWTTVEQTAASEIAVAAAATTDIHQNILVVEVSATDLDSENGYTHVSLNVPDLGAGDKTLTVIALLTGLLVKRAPANLPAVG
jgi:hypothetical protein